MNFSLQYIELNIDDSLIEIGERLVENGKIRNLTETEKNLWSADVEEGNTFEVEVQMSAGNVKAYTCECDAFAYHKVCTHIAGTLILLRSILKDRKQKAKSTKKTGRKTGKKLTTTLVVNQIDADDLRNFIRSYARGNRPFSLALKARFASQIHLDNNLDKYLQVLDSSINLHRPSGSNLTQRAFKSILSTTSEILNQAEDAIVLKNYREVVDIIEAIFAKVGPFVQFADDKNSDWHVAFRRAHLLTDGLLKKKDLGPDILDRIWSIYLNEAGRLFYYKANAEQVFYDLLLQLAIEPEQFEALEIFFKEHFEYISENENGFVNLVLFQLAILEKSNRNKEAQEIIEKYLSNPEILIVAIEDAINKNKFDKAQQLAQSGIKIADSPLTIHKLNKAQLEIAVLINDKNAIKQFAQDLFLYTFDMKYFDVLQKVYDKENFLPELMTLIEKSPYSLSKRDAIAAIYSQFADFKSLLNYIESIRSLDLLMEYDVDLIKPQKKKVYALYEDFIIHYLKTHAGRNSSIRVLNIIQHLRTIGARDLVSKLVGIFRTDFNGRHTLMEELEII